MSFSPNELLSWKVSLFPGPVPKWLYSTDCVNRESIYSPSFAVLAYRPSFDDVGSGCGFQGSIGWVVCSSTWCDEYPLP